MKENKEILLDDFEDKYLNKKKRCCKYCQILSLIFILVIIVSFIIFIIILISGKKKIDEEQKEIKEKEKQISDKEIEIKEKEKVITEKEQKISDQEKDLKEKEKKISEKEKQIEDKEIELKEKELNEREKVIKEKEKEIEELNNHPYLDSIPDEELKQARNSFNRNIFINPVNSKITLSYNLFIPDNYTNDIVYPLIVFIGDESTYGKEIILPINKTVGGPIWATKTIQKKHKCFVFVPQFNENIFNNNDESQKKEYSSMII